MTTEFDHVAAILDDRRRALRLLALAIDELELAEVPSIAVRLEALKRELKAMTPGRERPSRLGGQISLRRH